MRLGLLFAALLSSQAVALRPRNAYEVEAQELHDEEQQHAHNSSLAAESLVEGSASVTREEALQQVLELAQTHLHPTPAPQTKFWPNWLTNSVL